MAPPLSHARAASARSPAYRCHGTAVGLRPEPKKSASWRMSARPAAASMGLVQSGGRQRRGDPVSELDEIAPASAAIPPRARCRPVPEPIAVVILASDAITGEGTAASLRGQAGLTLLAADRLDRADVV